MPRNLCRECDRDFAATRDFDAHRVGSYAHDFSQEHLDGRRCLDEDELRERGFAFDSAKGIWFDALRRTAGLRALAQHHAFTERGRKAQDGSDVTPNVLGDTVQEAA